MVELQKIADLLSSPRNVVILSHRNPDGDAVGSSLALLHLLKPMFHNSKIILPSEFPVTLEFLVGSKDILIYDLDPAKATEVIHQADLAFCLDFNSLGRIDKVGEELAKRNIPIVMIDHHLYPENFADVAISEPEKSSTCELLYEVSKSLGYKKYFSKEYLECILTGIITDTGSFKYGFQNTTFSNVSEMISLGADLEYVQDGVNNHEMEKTLVLLGHCLHNRMKIYPEWNLGLIYLPRKDYIDYNIQRGETEGIVNQLLRLDVVHVACLITEQPNIIKISLRSKGNFSVEKLAKEYFNGGGHKNAAGGYMHGSLNAAIERLKEAVIQNQTEIINSN